MGLSKKQNAPKTLYTVIDFGVCSGCTVKEIIDDNQAGLIEFYVENFDDFELDNQAYQYFRKARDEQHTNAAIQRHVRNR